MEHAIISCFYREHIFVEAPAEHIVLHENHVHVWTGDVEKSDTDELLRILDADEITKSLRYYHEADRRKFITRRGSLRVILAKYLKIHPQDIRFTLDDNKKPLAENIHFNVTHSGNRFVIAVSAAPVGADIEEIDREFDFTAITDHHFSDQEKDHIRHSDDPIKTFYLLWTRKEALIKATSKGITDDLRSTPCFGTANKINAEVIGASGHWDIISYQIDPGFMISIAHGSKKQNHIFTITR